MFKRILTTTGDGSSTIHIPEWDEQYHSKHGAIREALHVFIKEGLHFTLEQKQNPKAISILEMGFGTGLNCLLTVLESEKNHLQTDYTALEAYPVPIDFISELNYPAELGIDSGILLNLHKLPWEQKNTVSPSFALTKKNRFFSDLNTSEEYDLIYFDAFGIRVQPELWTSQIFDLLFKSLKPNGVLVTYASNGSARRAMAEVGFSVQKIQGPPGKKEMVRACKQGKF